VPLALLGEALLERLHQLVEATERLDPALVLVGEQPLELLAQPFLRNLGADVEDRLDALEVRREREVEAVELRLVLHERRSCEVVEVVERQRHDARFQRFEQRQELARRNRQPSRFEMKEEVDQHRTL
jgi:hypothetical protein